MIDSTTEELFTLAEAARRFPGGGKHVSQLHRYRLDPNPATRLECLWDGGRWLTSDEAIARCLQARTAAKLNEAGLASHAKTNTASRTRQIANAKKELEAAGI